MSRFVRASKYRHVFGRPHKKEICYDGVRLTRSAWDSNLVSMNPKFFAVILDGMGGGSFLVVPLEKVGKVANDYPKVSGHKSAVMDIQWAPYNDNLIASCSEDGHVMVWQIPDGGLTETKTQAEVDLIGHGRKVGHVMWHPTANGILFSSSADLTIRCWNVDKAEEILCIEGHTDTIYSMSFNWDGSMFATTCKDKKIRLWNSHTGEVVREGAGHPGSKPSRVVWLTGRKQLFTTGFSRMSERQYALWDTADLSKHLKMEMIDTSSGVLMPFWDRETSVVYLGGKGDGNIRYYEIVNDSPHVCFLSEYKSNTPQRGLCTMPKRGVNVSECEVVRFMKLHANGLAEPIGMIVPRKSDIFQDDIFPDCVGDQAPMTSDEFVAGGNKEPILVSLKGGFKPTGKVEWKPPPLKEKKKDVTENPESDKDYREAFHKLKETIKKLTDETQQKDVTIRQLQQKIKDLEAK